MNTRIDKIWLVEVRQRREGTLKWQRWKLLNGWHMIRREAIDRKDWFLSQPGKDRTEWQARVTPFDRRKRC